MRKLNLFFWPRFSLVIFVPFLPHLALLVSHLPRLALLVSYQLREVLLLLLFKKLYMKRAGVVEKLGKSLTQGAFLSHLKDLFLL